MRAIIRAVWTLIAFVGAGVLFLGRGIGEYVALLATILLLVGPFAELSITLGESALLLVSGIAVSYVSSLIARGITGDV